MQVLQRRAGVGPKLVAQLAAEPVAGSQRAGWAAACVRAIIRRRCSCSLSGNRATSPRII
jgi:hypothetical protein